jgi:DNA polymerase I
MSEQFIAADLETELIARGKLAPPVVCLSTCDASLEPRLYHWTKAEPVIKDILEHRNIVGQNVSYDMGCICAQWPQLMPLVFQAYFDGRVADTMLNERLIHIARGCLDGEYGPQGVWIKHGYSLKDLALRYGLGVLDKDAYRLRYAEFRNTPLTEWPRGAREYALTDAKVTYQVFVQQSFYEEFLVDAAAQARAAFALYLQSAHGMITDAAACEDFIRQTQREIDAARRLLEAHSIVRPDGSKDTKVAKARMVQVSETLGLPLKKTDKDGVSLSAEATRDTGDDVLMAYSLYTSSSTALDRAKLLREGSYGYPLQTSFQPLVETGRISSREPQAPLKGQNFQNLPKKAGLRECFIPRPGYVFCSIDLNSAELHAVAQIQLWALGHSKLATALNAKTDVHSLLGSEIEGCSYEEFLAEKKGRFRKTREWAKAGNFTFWGGGRAKSFVASTNGKIEEKADKLTLQDGFRIFTAWERAWTPESQDYFGWTRGMIGDGLATVKQFVSGRVRANTDYCTTANTFFQGLVADALKAALLPIAHECYVVKDSPLYGSRPVLDLHDEIFLELVEDRAHEAAYRARDILVNTCNERYMPDVPVSAEPALMRRWYKQADTVFDDKGRLVCWEPALLKQAA